MNRTVCQLGIFFLILKCPHLSPEGKNHLYLFKNRTPCSYFVDLEIFLILNSFKILYQFFESLTFVCALKFYISFRDYKI